MAYYLVQAKPIPEFTEKLYRILKSGDIRHMGVSFDFFGRESKLATQVHATGFSNFLRFFDGHRGLPLVMVPASRSMNMRFTRCRRHERLTGKDDMAGLMLLG